MYHIKSDKRSQRSARLITAGLDRCLAESKFEDITISTLVAEATVGRATFYRLFDSATDVLVYECDQLFETMTVDHHEFSSINTWLQTNIDTFIVNAVLLETLIRTHQTQAIYAAQLRTLQKMPFLTDRLGLPTDQIDFLNASLAALLISTLSMWFEHHKKESAEKLFEMIKVTIQSLSVGLADLS